MFTQALSMPLRSTGANFMYNYSVKHALPLAFLTLKAAGVSHRGALQGHLFFCNQEDVDEFVGKSTNSKSLPKVGTEAMTL